jgi:hypothetical protein
MEAPILFPSTAHSTLCLTIWKSAFLPESPYFAVVDSQARVGLWKKDDEEVLTGCVSLGSLVVKNSPLCAYDWNFDKKGLAACTSFDQSLHAIFTPYIR